MKPTLLVFAGSNRQGSVNKKLAQQASQTAQRLGFEATYIDLKDYPIPLYDGDLEKEEGIPQEARALETLIKQHDAIIIASPEYNGAFTPLLKNTIDWVTRVDTGVLKPKVVGLMSASPGKGGGTRCLTLVRMWLESMRVKIANTTFSVPQAMQAFDGDTLEAAKQAELEQFISHVVETVQERPPVAV